LKEKDLQEFTDFIKEASRGGTKPKCVWIITPKPIAHPDSLVAQVEKHLKNKK
jgi:hypothetical protein